MNEHQGVPEDEATAPDFNMVRSALVRRLGGADNALVWSRIFFRCDSNSRIAHEVDGALWWEAPHRVLAAETGLTEKQARSAIDALVAGGFVLRENHGGRSYSYRPVTYLPNRADTLSAHTGTSICPPGQTNLPDEAVTPLLRQEDVKDTPVVPKGTSELESAFEQVWSMWPSQRRGTRKKSGSSFRTAVKAIGGVKHLPELLAAVEAHTNVWRSWPEYEQRFVPMMTTWLNQERWTGPLPESREGSGLSVVEQGRRVDEILRAREAAS